MRDTLTEMTYWTMAQCVQQLEEEVNENYIRNGRGSAGSPKRVLQRYGFKIRRKDKLLKAVKEYLKNVDVVKY